MGSGISAYNVPKESDAKHLSSSAVPSRPKQRSSKRSGSHFQSSTSSAPTVENVIISTLEEMQSKNLRCRMRPVSSSDVLLLSQRACAQLMFRMPGVNDCDASLLKRMLSKSGKSLEPSETHCVFVVEGSGLHEDLLACAAVAPIQRDCYRWQRAVSLAISTFSSADAQPSSPLDAVFAAAKQCSTFDKQFRKSLDPVGMCEVKGAHGCARDVVMRLAAISRAFEDAARSAACDLELVLRDFSLEHSVPDPSTLQGKRIVFVASNAQKSRGYAITTSSQYVLWHRPAFMAQLTSFSCSKLSSLPLPRISRPMPEASNNPVLFSNDVITWEGLYKQLCVTTESAIEAIFCQNHSPTLNELIAPPLATRIERGGLVCLFLQESPIFGVNEKLMGRKFRNSNYTNIVLGLDSMSAISTYKPYVSTDRSNLSLFTALSSRKLYANCDSASDESSLSDVGFSLPIASTETGGHKCQSSVDSCSFSPGLVVYSIPELRSSMKRNTSHGIMETLFAQPMWIESPLITVTWKSNGQVLESTSITLPFMVLSKFCLSCDDEENHPIFSAVVSVSCDVATGESNVRSRPASAASASDVTRSSLAHIRSKNNVQISLSSFMEKRWSILASSSLGGASQFSTQWAINSVKSLCISVECVIQCVSAIVSCVDVCILSVMDPSSQSQRTPCRRILDLFEGVSALRDSYGCADFSFLPMILKQTSFSSKISLGILYADLICRVSANAIFTICADDCQMRLALQMMYSLAVDESNTNAGIIKVPHYHEKMETWPWSKDVENWWENSVAVSSCARALNLIKVLPLFQAEFGTARGSNSSSSILETLLQNIWHSNFTFAADSPKKQSCRLSRAEFYASWIRAMAARTLQLLFLTEKIDWVDQEIKHLPSPCQYAKPLGWYAHFHQKFSVQKNTAFLVIDESLRRCEIQSDNIVRSMTFCETFCHMRFLLSSSFVSKLMHSRSVEDAHLPFANSDKNRDPHPYVTPRDYEPNDDFLPNPISPTISRSQQKATDLLDIGPLNFNARSQRVPLASTFGSSSWISPVYVSPMAPSSASTEHDSGLDFINQIQRSSHSNLFHPQHSQTVVNDSNKFFEPQSTLECMRTIHSLALKLLDVSFVFDLQFVMNALADVFVILDIVGSVHFDHENGNMIPLNRRSSQICQDMAATLYLRSMSCSRLNTGASLSMFRMMCGILSNGRANLVTRNFMPAHFRDFLCNGDVQITELEEHSIACVAFADALFGKVLNTHVVWAVEIGFQNNDPIMVQTCKRAEMCDVESVRYQSFDNGDSKKPLDWVVSALACPMMHTHSKWLSACNPEAPLNDIVVVSSSKTVHLVRATAQFLANAYASAIAASAKLSTPLDVSCVLVGYASMCCKFFGEWACIEKTTSFSENMATDCCPCQLLFGIVACSEFVANESPETSDVILSSTLEIIEPESAAPYVEELAEFALMPCMCDMLSMLNHHEHGDKHSSYDPALLCFCMCPSRAYCDVSFKHVGQYCSDSTMLLVESGLHCRKFKSAREGFRLSRANIMSLNVSACLFIGDQSVLKLLSQSSLQCDSAASELASLQCLCLDGCLNLTSSFMSKLSLLPCIGGLECLVLPSFEQSSVLMSNMTEIMQQKVKFRFETVFAFDDFVRQMKLQTEQHDVVDQLGHRSVQIVDPSLQFVSECTPVLSDSLQTMLLRGYREDEYRSVLAHHDCQFASLENHS
jgi:hypothetical protein